MEFLLFRLSLEGWKKRYCSRLSLLLSWQIIFAPRGRVELKAAIDACVNRQIPTSNVQSTSGKRSPVKLIFLDVDGVLNSHQSRFAKWLGETSAGSAKGFVK